MGLCLPRGFALPRNSLLFLPRGRAGLFPCPFSPGSPRRRFFQGCPPCPGPSGGLCLLCLPRGEIQPLSVRHTSRFRRSKGRAHVAIHDHTRRSKQKYFATAAFSRRRKNGLSGTENDPETVGVSQDVDGWQGHALCVAGGVVVEGGLRSSSRSFEPPSSMRTLVPASRCALRAPVRGGNTSVGTMFDVARRA